MDGFCIFLPAGWLILDMANCPFAANREIASLALEVWLLNIIKTVRLTAPSERNETAFLSAPCCVNLALLSYVSNLAGMCKAICNSSFQNSV
jgi:hypothetical protein